jgi:hypothetical protein
MQIYFRPCVSLFEDGISIFSLLWAEYGVSNFSLTML